MTEAAPPNLPDFGAALGLAPVRRGRRDWAAHRCGGHPFADLRGGAGRRSRGTIRSLRSLRLRWAQPGLRTSWTCAAGERATPYLLAGSGVAFCFRAGVALDIGAEGQIRTWRAGRAAAVALHWPASASWAIAPASLIGAAAFGALWSAIATAIHLGLVRVHEVLVTLCS